MAESKTVLITGATRGIGLELAGHYQKAGWKVIGAARDLNKADQLEALSPYKIVQIDTSDEASILAAAQQLEGESVDLLINNAGIAVRDTFATATKESMLCQFNIDTVGPLLVTRAFVPHLRAAVATNGSALVAQMSSYMGSIALNNGGGLGPGMYGYRASKTGLNMINASLALDLKEDKIISVALHPGYVVTDMNAGDGSIKTDESVAGLTNVLDGVKPEDSGKFFNYDGSILPW